MTRIDIMRQIVSECQARRVTYTDTEGKSRKLYVDVQTANLLLEIYDRSNEQRRASFDSLPLPLLCRVAWGMVTPRT